MDSIVKELIENDIVEESNSRGGSAAFLVRKPPFGQWRLVTSFQELNSSIKTRKIDDFIQALYGYKYFVTIDFHKDFIELN